MGTESVRKLVWVMGLPMIVSMVLQAIYNIVDTAFTINMAEGGYEANIALGYSFPIQILMIAVGVGLGIGVNASISKSLGERNKEKAAKAAYNGLTLAFIFYLLFLLFGLFFAEPFIRMQASMAIEDEAKRELVVSMGSKYLRICTVYSFGQMLFTIFERFLQATGRNFLSMVGQVAGALTNIVLDYVFIYPLNMGVAGAAYATIIGQMVSLILDAFFHFLCDKEIDNHIHNFLLSKDVLKEIFSIGVPAMIMQALLSSMMFTSNLVLATSKSAELLQATFAIYYKIQQMALFACFGLSNALITLMSYNYGKGDKKRSEEVFKYGLIDSLIVSAVLVILFESLASPLASLFNLAGGSNEQVASLCVVAIRLASWGFIFMAPSIAIQGLLQGLGARLSPLVISLLRLAILLIPLEFLFLNVGDEVTLFWISFPLSELLTVICAYWILKREKEDKIHHLEEIKMV